MNSAQKDREASLSIDNPILQHHDDHLTNGWRIRSDVRRAIAFELLYYTTSVDKVTLLHPIDAVALSLFDGVSSYNNVVGKLSYLSDSTQERAHERLAPLVLTWRDRGLLTERRPGADTPTSRVDPASLLVHKDAVDLTTPWLYRPLMAYLRPTERCQRACRYCNVERRPHLTELGTQEWIDIITQLIDAGIICFTFSGGDALLYPGVLELVSHLVSRGIQPAVSTKVHIGRDLAPRIKASGLEVMQISLDCDVEEVEDYLLGTPGSTRQLLDTVAHLVAAGIKVDTSSVLTPYNALHFPRMAKRLADMGVRQIRASQYGASIFAEAPDAYYLDPSVGTYVERQVYDLYKSGINVNYSYMSLAQTRKNFADRSRCTAGLWGVLINADGTVITCDQLPNNEEFIVGDLRWQRFSDIWSSPALDRFRTRRRADYEGTVCAECDEFERCSSLPGICFRDAYKAYGRAFAPSPFCPKAPTSSVRMF